MEIILFKRWSNKKYALLNTFHKIIHIGTLALSCIILKAQPAFSQSDTLSPQMFFDLEEVETSTELETEICSSILHQLLLLKNEQLTLCSSGSIAQLLNYFPGIDIRTRGVNGIQSDLSVQGGSFDQSMLLLNGIDISDPQTGHFNLDLPVPLSQMTQIEIIKGPATKSLGLSAYSGAINLVTKPKDSLSCQGEFSFGQFNTYFANGAVHIPLGITRNMLSISLRSSDGYQTNRDYISSNIYFHSTNESKVLQSDFIFGWNQQSFGANAFYSPLFPEQYENTKTGLVALKFQSMQVPDKLKGSISWRRHYDHFLLFRNNPSFYENYHLTDVFGAEIGNTFSTSAGIIKLGIKVRYEQILSTSLGNISISPMKVKGVDQKYYDHFSARNYASFSINHLYQFKNIYMDLGILIHSGIKNISKPGIYPGFDLSYHINKQLYIFSSVNRSMRLPTFTDLYYSSPQNIGNPYLKPEKALTIEGGAKFNTNALIADIALFYRKGTESIDWIWTDTIWKTKNLSELNTYGGESSLTFLPKQLNDAFKFINHLRVSYSVTEICKTENNYISNYALDMLREKLIADIKLNLTKHISISGIVLWQVRNGSFLFYETPESSPVDTAYEPFFLADINAEIKIKQLKIYFSITNLFDKSYRDIGSVIMPGRRIMTGLKYSY